MKEKHIIIDSTIRKWGNSHGIRLSKMVLNSIGLEENDDIIIKIYHEKLLIEKKISNLTLKKRLEAFYKKPLDEINEISTTEEVDFGAQMGDELW